MSRDLTPEEARDRFISRRRQRQAEETVRTYGHRLDHFVRWAEEHDVEQMSDLDGWLIDEYRHARESEDVSPSTVKGSMVSLKQLLEFCERIDVVEDDLAKKVEIPKLTKDEETSDERLTAERASSLLEYFRETNAYFGHPWHAFLELAWHTGCRLGGLIALDLDDYDPDAGTVHFRHRPDLGTPLKNQAAGERIVGINDDAVLEALDTYIARGRTDKRDEYGREPLFAARQGRPSDSTVRGWSYLATQPCLHQSCPHSRKRSSCDWVDRNGASKCPSSRSPHAIRTGSITWMLNATDGDIEWVARRVNAKPDTIRRYYDKATVEEEFENRQQKHTDSLDINDEPA
ncbi:site-specific integrase [Halorubrum sp. SS5]|nr:site-specific integrase [Halorubrum sp. SS5]